MRISDWSSDVCSSDLFMGALVRASCTKRRREAGSPDRTIACVPAEAGTQDRKRRARFAGLLRPQEHGSPCLAAMSGGLYRRTTAGPMVPVRVVTSPASVSGGTARVGATPTVPAPARYAPCSGIAATRSEEHTSELQSIMRFSYADFCLKKKHK